MTRGRAFPPFCPSLAAPELCGCRVGRIAAEKTGGTARLCARCVALALPRLLCSSLSPIAVSFWVLLCGGCPALRCGVPVSRSSLRVVRVTCRDLYAGAARLPSAWTHRHQRGFCGAGARTRLEVCAPPHLSLQAGAWERHDGRGNHTQETAQEKRTGLCGGDHDLSLSRQGKFAATRQDTWTQRQGLDVP